MRRDDEDGRDNVLLVQRDGTLCIAVARCVHCERVTLAPTSDQCGCGAELHPVVRFVKLDHPYRLDQIQPSG